MVELSQKAKRIELLLGLSKVVMFLYFFLVSITLMGTAFKGSGKEFVDVLMRTTENPFIGLVIGIVVTSVIQSSSTTTTIIVTMVAAGTLPMKSAIPMVMGANIGTTVTNTIVSFGYVGRKSEFERSFGASIVHDMFNIYATIILFPLELYTGVIFKTATAMTGVIENMGGFNFTSPLKYILNPVAKPIIHLLDNHVVLMIVAFAGLFLSMSGIVRNMKGIVMEKIESALNRYLFRNALLSMLFGAIFTSIVQSSSISTSVIIPLVGAGVLTIEQIFPYTLGANIGTTITALLAVLALDVGKEAAMTVALCHLTFNVFGIALFYPLKALPIKTATFIASYVSRSKKHFLIFITVYILLHVIPIIFAKL